MYRSFSCRCYECMILFLIDTTCKVQHLLEGRQSLQGIAYFDDNKVVALTGDLALVRGNVVFQHKTWLKSFIYLHLYSPCILFHKANHLKFVPSEITYVYTEFLMLYQLAFLYTKVQVVLLNIK